VPFRTYMDWVLNDPLHGAYASGRLRIGPQGDFCTAPSLGDDFAALLAPQLADWLQQLGPGPLALVETGAGEGSLAADLAAALAAGWPQLAARTELVLVDPSAGLVERQRRRLSDCPLPVRWSDFTELAERPLHGVVLAHEVLDALPVERIVWDGQRWRRQRVALAPAPGAARPAATADSAAAATAGEPPAGVDARHAAGGATAAAAPAGAEVPTAGTAGNVTDEPAVAAAPDVGVAAAAASAEAAGLPWLELISGEALEPEPWHRLAELGLADPGPGRPAGWSSELHPGLQPWLSACGAALAGGVLLVIDYALEAHRYYAPQRSTGTLMAYRAQQACADPLRDPGHWDLTAHLCLESLAAAATASGWQGLGACRQGQALLALGLAQRLHGLQRPDAGPLPELLHRREALLRLVDPAALGDFRWIAFARGMPGCEAPPLFLRDPAPQADCRGAAG